MTLPTTITGPLDAPPVLFLHGFMGAASDWDATAEVLTDTFRCVAVDLPGHGAAVGLPEEVYTFGGTLAAIAATLDDLGIARCRVVGYSMGARFALGFALRFPERVTRLVLESGSPGLRTEEERAARRATDEERARQIEADFERFVGDWYRMELFASLKHHPALRAELVAKRRRNIPAEVARSLRGAGTGQQPSLWADLGHLAVPTLALAGGRDRKYADLAFAMAVAGPPVMPAVVPAGHIVHAEQPDLFQALVRDFLRDATPEPQPALT
jgi:2-succinyl-6-hydroxy-2,4-cyclohexadiene-1-carboxylate synthase